MQIFVKLPENEDDKKEWALIEMQGELESRLGSGENLSGKFIGDLVQQLFHGLTILSHKIYIIRALCIITTLTQFCQTNIYKCSS